MKKLLYSCTLIAIIGTVLLVACNKDLKQPTASSSTIKTSNTEKSIRMSDSDLIDAIKGRNPDYAKLGELEDVLYDNAKLSSSVIHTLIDETRMPNYMVETVLILCAPVSATDLSYLHSQRPELVTTAIVAAANSNLNDSYIIVNCNPRQVLFGQGMVKKSTCEDGCGEGEIKVQSGALMIDLTSETTPLDPAEMKPCTGSTGAWVCGTPRRVHCTGTDGTTSNWSVTCTQSTDKCIKNVVDATRDH